MCFENPNGSVTNFVQKLTSDDLGDREEAERQIFARYFQKLVVIAIHNLSPHIQRRTGPDDVAQSAMKSFFIRNRKGAYDLESRDELMKLLAKITLNKVRGVARWHQSQKRDVDRDRPFEQDNSGGRNGDHWVFHHMAEAEPSVEETTVLKDVIEQLPEQDLKDIVCLRVQGYTDKEIAKQLGCSGETIRLRRKRISHILCRVVEDM